MVVENVPYIQSLVYNAQTSVSGRAVYYAMTRISLFYEYFTLGGFTMVQLIVGRKGKGKTKQLLDKVNAEVKDIAGNVVYLDKSTKHMFELNNKIRLINVADYMITNSDEFVGFICGIISQDHDLQQMYFDSFLKIACLEGSEEESQVVDSVIRKLEAVSTKFNVDFVLSISLDAHELSEDLKSKIIVSL